MSSIIGQPLTHCPVCSYDLAGLPKNHRCPECGFEYDEQTLVWDYQYSRSMVWLNVATSLFWFLVFSSKVANSLRASGAIDWIDMSLGVLVGGSLVFLLFANRVGNRVVVGRAGFARKFGLFPIRFSSWDEVHFDERGRDPVWVAGKWRRFFSTRIIAQGSLDEGVVWAVMYDRWKRFHEGKNAPEKTCSKTGKEAHDDKADSTTP